MVTDPAKLLQKYVKIKGLASKPELNSQVGFVDSYLADRSRYMITLPRHVSAAPIALKSDNLELASIIDRSKAKVEEIMFMGRAVMQDERFKETIRRTYTSIDQRLPGPMKPQHLLAGILLAFMLMVRMIGFTKFIFVSSVMMVILAVALPDLMSGERNIKTLATNFPMRWKEAIEQNTGLKPSKRVANGILVLFLLFAGKVIFVPKPASTETFDYSSIYQKEDSPELSDVPSFTMEEIYKLGYQDATNQKPFGESLPSPHKDMIFSSKSTPRLEVYDDFNYIPSSPPKKNKFGFGTAMAAISVFRTVKELGFVNGKFEPSVFIANARNMPPLKMAFSGFMLYKLLSAFS